MKTKYECGECGKMNATHKCTECDETICDKHAEEWGYECPVCDPYLVPIK